MKKFGHKIRIFYFNWKPAHAEAVSRVLRESDFDFEVRRSCSAEDFITRVAETSPDVILADHSVESSSLGSVLQMLRQKGVNVPVMLVTNFASEEFAGILMGAGVSDYVFVEKPARLPVAIAALVETSRALTQSRNKLEQSRKEFSDLVGNLPVGIAIWNAQRQLVYFNRALLLFSYDDEDVFLNKWEKINLDLYDCENNSVSLERDLLNPAIANSETVTRPHLYILKEDGSRRYVAVTATPSKDVNGVVTGAFLVFVDATMAKVAASETKALTDLVNAKNNELSQFGYVVSHKLRDPIAKILGLASICDTATEESKFIVQKITEEANRLDSVVKDLNFITSVRNVEKERRESLHFDHEFSLVLQVLRREIQDSKAMIETDFEDQNQVFTVKSYLYSVLYNLISNSIKYRDISKQLSIKMRTYRIGNYACLSVKDNGVGIDLAKNSEKMFGLYRRFHSADIPGKGVGLHFIKKYAEVLGGKIEIQSAPQEGTELKVYFLNDNNQHICSEAKGSCL